MKILLLFSFLTILAISCGPVPDELSTAELAKEKEEVIGVINAYNKAFVEKNFSGIVPTLSEDVIFFGTDSAETIKSLTEFKKVITAQFNAVEKTVYGEMVDISIQMDKRGTLASIIYGIPADYYIQGKSEHYFLRIARTLKKEGGRWVIVSGIVGIARTQGRTEQQ